MRFGSERAAKALPRRFSRSSTWMVHDDRADKHYVNFLGGIYFICCRSNTRYEKGIKRDTCIVWMAHRHERRKKNFLLGLFEFRIVVIWQLTALMEETSQ